MNIKTILQTNKHFSSSQGVQFASSLSYSTLLSVVPITTLLFYLFLQSEILASFFDQIRDQLFTHLLPTSREQIEIYLIQTALDIHSFSYLGIAIIFLSAIWLSLGIERALNHIWHVKTPRKILRRIPAHTILWLIAPLLMIASISLSTWIASLPYLHEFTQEASFASKALPYFISSAALFLLYFFVPNTHVHLKHAGLAALMAGSLFEISKWAFTIYITKYAVYEKIYGALATLPIFMLWVFISWVVILWGASLCFTLQKQDSK